MRVLCHAQHLTGVGHFVRMHAIAAHLAERHEVHLVSGGRDVPLAPAPREPAVVVLPPIARKDGALVPLLPGARLEAVLEERARRLEAAAAAIRPDVLLVDHYPFSKWELEDEVRRAAAAARRASPGALVIASLRDVAPRTRHEALSDEAWAERVLAALARDFDGLLVHADPAFARLEEHFPAASRIAVPIAYTGFVRAGEPSARASRETVPFAVLSAGGGVRSLALLRLAAEAVAAAIAGGALDVRRILVFPGGDLDARAAARVRAAAPGVAIEIRGFEPGFRACLRRAALSVGRSGYNTVVDLLGGDVPAVVVPDPAMSDQEARARRLGELGLAETATEDRESIARAVVRAARAGRRAPSTFRLDGAQETGRILEERFSCRSSASSASPSTPL